MASTRANVPKRATTRRRTTSRAVISGAPSRFEATRLESLFPVLDAVAWMSSPSSGEVAQFADLDPRTAGKLLKNAQIMRLINAIDGRYVLENPYPYKGTREQKTAMVREALLRLPLLVSVRQFLQLGDTEGAALRKAATVAGIIPYVEADLKPLLAWARSLDALRSDILAEDLVEEAVAAKERRHHSAPSRKVVFLSHSSHDKPLIRQLATDLDSAGIEVWLDEQRINVGDSIPEKISQGLAESDYFLIAISENSVKSDWVKRELNSALMKEIEKRRAHVLPLKLDQAKMPEIISDKRYADFSESYRAGYSDLVKSIGV